MRSVRRRAAAQDSVLAGVPVELHAPLLALAQAQAALDEARHEVTRAAAYTTLRWRDLDPIVRKLQYQS